MLTDAVPGHVSDGQGRLWGRGARTALDLQQPDQGAGSDPARHPCAGTKSGTPLHAVSLMTHGCVNGPGGALEQGHGGEGQGQGQGPRITVQAQALVISHQLRYWRLADSARRRQLSRASAGQCLCIIAHCCSAAGLVSSIIAAAWGRPYFSLGLSADGFRPDMQCMTLQLVT